MRSCFKTLTILFNNTLRQTVRYQHDLGCLESHVDFCQLIKQSLYLNKCAPKITVSSVGSASMIGPRASNEDRFKIKELAPDLLYFAVYDGHGGSFCAEFCNQHMEDIILSNLKTGETNLQAVLEASFSKANSLFNKAVASLSDDDEEMKNSGTTATVCLLKDSTQLVIAHVGDSQALLCRNSDYQKLTIDHNCQLKSEKERILRCGGEIFQNYFGTSAVNNRLAMTRSIGDLCLKSFGVISQPDIREVNIDHEKDSFIILTTDGVSNVLSNQEQVHLVNQSESPKEAALLVADQALHCSSDDNVTILVIPLGAWGKFRSTNSFNYGNFGRELCKSGRY